MRLLNQMFANLGPTTLLKAALPPYTIALFLESSWNIFNMSFKKLLKISKVFLILLC
jgi:hypothetical protein